MGMPGLLADLNSEGHLEGLLRICRGRQWRDILNARSYAERAAIRLMEILLHVDAERGTGRLYLPPTPEGVK
jgi:hypothetical protein